MKSLFDFIYAAFPWLIMGLCLAAFFVIMANRKEKNITTENYGSLGMLLGLSIGSAFSLLFTGHNGIGMSMGMLIGLVVGTCIEKKE